MTDTIQLIKERVRIADIMTMFGFPPIDGNKKEYRSVCHLHSGDNKTSFSLDLDKNRFFCFGCGNHGSVIDFVMAAKNCSLGDAIRFLKDQAGLYDMPQTDQQKQQVKKAVSVIDQIPYLEAIIYQWGSLFISQAKIALNIVMGFKTEPFDNPRIDSLLDLIGRVELEIKKLENSYDRAKKESNYNEIVQSLTKEKK